MTLLTFISYDYVKELDQLENLIIIFLFIERLYNARVIVITTCGYNYVLSRCEAKRESEIDSIRGLQMCLLCLQLEKKTHLNQHAILCCNQDFCCWEKSEISIMK